MRRKKEILEYADEMFDRVWFVRAHASENLTLPEDIQSRKMKALERIEKKYGLVYQETEVPDFNYGYWSGILAALRWVLGSEKDFLDT